MICSTMHCYNEAKQEMIPHLHRWWVVIPNPAPFCDECKKKHDKTTR